MVETNTSFKLTLGAELEWSDVDRTIDIPKELGSWEGPKVAGKYLGSEIDIVNTRGKWTGVAVDPLAVDCPVGGEIHTVPSYTAESQLMRIMRILDLFPTVNVACPNHGHIHVGIPGILEPENLEDLKNIFRYLKKNEKAVLDHCCGLSTKTIEDIQKSATAGRIEPWVKDYLLCGDAKQVNPEVYDRVEKASSTKEILDILNEVKCYDYVYVREEDESYVRRGILSENSHRTAVNVFNLVKMESIEFRCFRATLNPEEIYSCLVFSWMFIKEALEGEKGRPVEDLLRSYNFVFPELEWDEELAVGWQETRHSKGRSGPFKKSSGVLRATEDPIVIGAVNFSEFENALSIVTGQCAAHLLSL